MRRFYFDGPQAWYEWRLQSHAALVTPLDPEFWSQALWRFVIGPAFRFAMHIGAWTVDSEGDLYTNGRFTFFD
jgi:hypothetical protein